MLSKDDEKKLTACQVIIDEAVEKMKMEGASNQDMAGLLLMVTYDLYSEESLDMADFVELYKESKR